VGLWSLTLLVIDLSTTNPVYRALTLLAAINVLLAWRADGAAVRRLLRWIGSAATLSVGLDTLVSHNGLHVVATLPAWLPGVGGPLYAEAALYGLDIGLGVAAALAAASALGMLVDLPDVIDALPSRLQRTGGLLALSAAFIPGLRRSATAIRESEILRGVAPRRFAWASVAVPVVLSALEDSMERAEAMEARGFGTGPRSSYVISSTNRGDLVLLASAIVALCAWLGALLSGLVRDWVPSPGLSVPDVSGLPLLSCLVLSLPSAMTRR
jgi:energy-coupling factor transport system permease protein